MSENTSNEAKTEIMRRIKQALSISQQGPAPQVPRDYRLHSQYAPGSPEVVADMIEKLKDYGALVIECELDKVPAQITEILRQNLPEVNSVVVPHGLDKTWCAAVREAGVELKVDNPLENPLSKEELDHTDAVLTAARVGISISGTIALDGESDQGRRAITLLPDYHICVLKKSDIYELVPEAIAVLGQHPQRPTTWFAGPSATADIELRRVQGVHGPRNLVVVLAG